MAEKLQGIFTPTLVPIDAQGQINEAELRRFIRWLIASGVHGLYPNGSTGEFTRFNEEERRQIVRITCDEARGRVPILAGAAEANVKETLGACEAYAAMGARAVAIVSPIYYRLSPESVYAYFAEIARYTPIDITLYNIPMFASPIDVPTIRRQYTRLNSSHLGISYAVFCLKKKTTRLNDSHRGHSYTLFSLANNMTSFA